MMRGIVFLAMAAALAAQERGRLIIGYPNGVGLEIHTESSGTAVPGATKGSGIVWEGHAYRVVEDGRGNVLFSYEVESVSGADPEGMLIRIKPMPPERAKGEPPTVNSVREYRVKQGEALKVNILHNPSTGETIYDVLRPNYLAEPHPRGLSISYIDEPAKDGFTLRQPKIVVNGEEVDAQVSVVRGKALRISLPGHGSYILTLDRTAKFSQSAFVERSGLVIVMDGDFVQVTSKGNVLETAERAPVWVYHDPKHEPATALKREIADREAKLAEYLRIYRADMPEVQIARAQIERLKQQPEVAVIAGAEKAEDLVSAH